MSKKQMCTTRSALSMDGGMMKGKWTAVRNDGGAYLCLDGMEITHVGNMWSSYLADKGKDGVGKEVIVYLRCIHFRIRGHACARALLQASASGLRPLCKSLP